MPRQINVGFNQGPTTLWGSTGKYGVLVPRTLGFAISTSTTTTPELRRYQGGHYIALQPADITSTGIPNGGTVTGTYPNATVTGAVVSNAGPVVKSSSDGTTGSLVVQGLVIRLNWNDIESTAGSFNYTKTDRYVAQCRALGVLFIPMIIVRTFDGHGVTNDGTNPMPTDIASKAEWFSTGASGTIHSGWQGWRWSPTVRSRFNNLCSKLGTRYDADIYFGGIATQETASGSPTGGSSTIYTVGSYVGKDAYSASGFQLGLDDEVDAVFNNFPHARGFHYQNFLQGNQSLLTNYAAYMQPKGAWFGGPDLVTGSTSNSNIVNNCYPNYTLYHNGAAPIPAKGPTFCGIQHGEWNGTGVGDSPPVIANLFNYATSSFTFKPSAGYTGALDWRTGSPLNCDGLMWDYENGTGRPNFQSDLVPMMKFAPTFGTFVP